MVLTIIFCLLLLTLTASDCQRLTAIYSEDKLPVQIFDQAPYYDGKDSIYLFGGYVPHSPTSALSCNYILKYTISSDTVTWMGTTDRSTMAGGTVQEDLEGTLHFFGQSIYPSSDVAIKFDLANNATRALPSEIKYPYNSIKFDDTSNIVYLFGYDYILEVDLGSSVIRRENLTTANRATVKVGRSAVSFDNKGDVWRRNFDTGETETIHTAGYPYMTPNVATDGIRYAYYYRGITTSPPEIRTHALIQLDMETYSYIYIHVDDSPFGIEETIISKTPATIFVEQLNRIYFFGGRYLESVDNFVFVGVDKIWYVDLNELVTTPSSTISVSTTTPLPSTTVSTTTPQPSTTLPTTTLLSEFITCQHKLDGMYPHPFDCSKFVGCLSGQVFGIFDCPSTLLFDPVARTCLHPDLVDCELTCIGRPDGAYPHPYDCSLFVMCFEDELDVHECPPPLLFDKHGLFCNFPQFVECP